MTSEIAPLHLVNAGHADRVGHADGRAGHAGGVRQHIGHPLPGLPVLREGIAPAHHHADGGCALIANLLDVARERLAVHAVQFRLRVEEIHLAWPTVHEQLDDRPGSGGVMTGARMEIGRLIRLTGQRARAAKIIVTKQMRQGPAQQAATHAAKKIAPRDFDFGLGVH